MAVITTGNHPKALWPGVHAWYGISYKKFPLEWPEIFSVKDASTKAYEEDVEGTSFGLPQQKPQGEAISYDDHTQGATTRYTHVTWGLGYIVTEEEEEDNQYEKFARSRAESLAFSMRTGAEVVHADILNFGFTSAVGADGKELLATDHPTVGGGTQQNELTIAADFSEAALEDLTIIIGQAKNSRGLQIALRPQKLIVPVALQYEATRVVKSELRSGTAENDINAMRAMGILPGGIVVNHYLSDADAWFVTTDAPNGLTHFTRRAMAFVKDSDFDTANKKHKATERYSAGWSDWRGCYGSPGA